MMSEDQPPAEIPMLDAEAAVARLEALLDEALDESFPASDPLSSMRFEG